MHQTILIKPVITEKSLKKAGAGWYTFIVAHDSTKPQIAQAVSQQFGVVVTSVRTMNKKGMTKRTGKKRIEMVLSPMKKALVQLKDKQKIDLFEVAP